MAINPAHSERLLQLEREVSQLRSAVQSRTPATTGNRRPIVRWAKTVAEEATPYPISGTVFPFVFVQRSFDELTGATTETILGDEMAPQHKLCANDYIGEGSVLPVTEIDGQWWRHDETGGADDCKIVKLNAVARPAYEVLDGSSYRHYTPGATALKYARALGTGELILGSESVQCVNIAQRSYGLSGAARAEYNLAVPIGGGQHALVPLATDPYVPMVSLEYRPGSGSVGIILSPTAEFSMETCWIQQDEYIPLSFGRVPPLDSEEGYPLFARAHRSGMYVCKPGKYLIIAGVTFSSGASGTDYGTPKVLTTSGASAGTAHTHTYNADGPWGQCSMQVKGNLITAATPSDATLHHPDTFQHVNLDTFYQNDESGDLELMTSFVIAPSPGSIVRYNLMAGFMAWNFDTGSPTPAVEVSGGYIRVIPISDYIHGQSIPTNDKHTKQYNPYASGSFVWHEGFSSPPLWDKDGAAV